MKNLSLTIDGKKILCTEGKMILWAALENGIYIPNLCAIQEKTEPSASCRLCFVEVEGKNEPVVACAERVQEGMVVSTRGKNALRLARTAVELILANHPVDCGHCLKNRSCELQRIAHHLGIKLTTKRFRKIERNLPIDESSPLFNYDPNKCVLCGKCVWVCQEKLGVGMIGFTRRGFKRRVSTFQDKPIGQSICGECTQCVTTCPVGSMTFKPKTSISHEALE
ncbi:MAG TPA: 2Fe-2S iron-sulfur cluster-binding protein [Thermodesulfobacteriota bacterium]|nr:2Fe-2S iron-sulfur cluster-binding protein [Thermodesulfobacteriota bacterium]